MIQEKKRSIYLDDVDGDDRNHVGDYNLHVSVLVNVKEDVFDDNETLL
jgi:hypothetical protein